MANFKNTIYNLISNKRTVPYNSIGTGTVSTNGNAVTGVGTLFTTEMPMGSWIVDLAQDEIRYIYRVESDTLAFMTQPFTVDLAALTPLDRIPEDDAQCVSIAFSIPAAAAAGEIDGVVFPAGSTASFSKDSRDRSSKRDLVDPFIVDATLTTMLVLIQK